VTPTAIAIKGWLQNVGRTFLSAEIGRQECPPHVVSK
jgi:hypothetical protein